MPIQVSASFAFEFEQPGDALLQFEAAALPEQRIVETATQLSDTTHCARVAAHNNIGERIWISGSGRFEASYDATVEIERQIAEIDALAQLDAHLIPGEAVEYLFDSRFCPVGTFQNFVDSEFGNLSGGARIAAMRDWIADHFEYAPGASGPQTNATDSFVKRQGICRDYAHVMVVLARASVIPARYVACYAPGVTPQDFHAVSEVFLADPQTNGGGAWHLVDPTGMADPAETVKIGVGRDAADVSFLTNFAPATFLSSNVEVESN